MVKRNEATKIGLQVGWRQLAFGLAVLAGVLGLMLWWSSPARSQGSGPATVEEFAFVARADNPVDALAASSVAGQLGAPVYLTFPDALHDEAAEGLQASDPQVVVLAGGSAALSEAVEQQIRDLLPEATVRRFAGTNRTETAKLVNELTAELGVSRPVVAGATVAGDVGIDGTLTVEGSDVSAALRDLTARVDSLEGDLVTANSKIDALETDLAAANGRIQTLESTLAGVIRDGDTLTFSGMNVQIVNGQGATPTTNGLGNLIVGYGEDHTGNACQPSSDDCRYKGDGTADARTGSHNLVVGVDHAYTSYAGLLAGHDNTTSGASASVTGGRNNTASGNATSVSGGRSNTASDSSTSVSGGRDNTASNLATSVTGGFGNTANGLYASVSGGDGNTASGLYASVSGGFDNTALAEDASISGGWGNRIESDADAGSISGGYENLIEHGFAVSILGDKHQIINGDYAFYPSP